jgi:hypothetical protein
MAQGVSAADKEALDAMIAAMEAAKRNPAALNALTQPGAVNGPTDQGQGQGNDRVIRLLDSGEFVIPESVVQREGGASTLQQKLGMESGGSTGNADTGDDSGYGEYGAGNDGYGDGSVGTDSTTEGANSPTQPTSTAKPAKEDKPAGPGYIVESPDINRRPFVDPRRAKTHRALNANMEALDGRPMTQIAQQPTFQAAPGGGQFRNDQAALVNQLQMRAAGQGPTVSGAQMNAGMEQSIAAANAAAVTNRGGNPALAQRIVAQNAATQQQGIAQAGGIAALQEQQGAQQLLSGTLDQARGADVTERGQTIQADVTARGQDVQSNIAQGQLSVQEQQNRDALVQQYTQMGIDVDQAQFMAAQEAERMRVEAEMAASGLNAQTYQTEYASDASAEAARYAAQQARRGQQTAGMFGAVGAGLGAAAAFSDERLKTNIDESAADPALHAMLDELHPAEYEYKEPGKPLRGPGKHLSVMAQNLLKTETGSRLVTETPDGLVVDYGKGFGVLLAAEAHLHQRLKRIEQSIGRSN